MVLQGKQGQVALRSKRKNYRAVTKGDNRREFLEWLDVEHGCLCLLALMGEKEL